MNCFISGFVTSDEARDIIRNIARRAHRSLHRFGWSLEEIEQDLRVRVLERASRYDPTRAPAPFVITVAKSGVASLIRHEQTEKRGGGAVPQSLHFAGADVDTPDELLVRAKGDRRAQSFVVDDFLATLPRESRQWIEIATEESPQAADAALGLGRRASAKNRATLQRACRVEGFGEVPKKASRVRPDPRSN